MKTLTHPWIPQIMFEGDGEGAGTGGEGGDGGSMFTPGKAEGEGGEAAPEYTGPDFINEKYRGAENPMEAQAKAYAEAMGLVTKKRDDIKGEIEGELRETITQEIKDAADKESGVPGEAKDYGYPEGLEAPNEEIDTAFKDWAKSNGVSQEAFEELAQMYAQTLPDLSGEREKLGDNADARIAAMDDWGSKNIPESLHGAASEIMSSAAGFEVMEHFMAAGRDAGYSPQGGVPAQALTREQIRAKQNDPRYHEIGKIDPAFQKEVQNDWATFAKRNGK